MGEDGQAGGWQIDEEAAGNYERFLVPAVFDPWAADLVDAAGIHEDDRVLDVACGTGIVARHAARRVGPSGEVAAIDINPAMLAVARDVAARDAPVITFKEASADDLPFGDDSFDVVLCQQGLQFFPDRRAALAEFGRILAPGGRLGLSTCGSVERQPGYRVLTEVLAQHVGVHAAEVIGSPYSLGDPDELRGLVNSVGFAATHLRRVYTTFRAPSAEAFLQGETSSSPLGDIVAQLDADVVAAIVDDLDGALEPYRDDDGIVFPFETLVLTATS